MNFGTTKYRKANATNSQPKANSQTFTATNLSKKYLKTQRKIYRQELSTLMTTSLIQMITKQ